MSTRTRTRARLPVLLLAAACLALAACSSSDDGAADATTTSASASETAAPTTPAAPATTVAAPRSSTTGPGATIGVADFTFQAATVAPGVTVRLLNGDSTAHTVESRDGLWTFDTTTETFPAPATPGSYAIFCGIHSSMTGTLTVA
jgi:plastocyanin